MSTVVSHTPSERADPWLPEPFFTLPVTLLDPELSLIHCQQTGVFGLSADDICLVNDFGFLQ